MDAKEIGREGVDFIIVARDRGKWSAVVNAFLLSIKYEIIS